MIPYAKIRMFEGTPVKVKEVFASYNIAARRNLKESGPSFSATLPKGPVEIQRHLCNTPRTKTKSPGSYAVFFAHRQGIQQHVIQYTMAINLQRTAGGDRIARLHHRSRLGHKQQQLARPRFRPRRVSLHARGEQQTGLRRSLRLLQQPAESRWRGEPLRRQPRRWWRATTSRSWWTCRRQSLRRRRFPTGGTIHDRASTSSELRTSSQCLYSHFGRSRRGAC